MPKFRGIRVLQYREEVTVVAENYDQAIQKIEDDTEDVVVVHETEGDWEISGRLQESVEK